MVTSFYRNHKGFDVVQLLAALECADTTVVKLSQLTDLGNLLTAMAKEDLSDDDELDPLIRGLKRVCVCVCACLCVCVCVCVVVLALSSGMLTFIAEPERREGGGWPACAL
jgi:hypothetical protein